MNAHGQQLTAWNCFRLLKAGEHNIHARLLIAAFAFALATSSWAQTAWTGATSSSWKIAGNWTAGVPSSTVDAIIGDTNFTGPNQPTISGGTASCKSLTLGTGAIASTLTVSKGLTVYGDLTIGTNGAITHTVSAAISVKGNWTNSGSYAGSKAASAVTFSGTTQTIAGNTASSFRKLNISATSTTTLARNISVANTLSVSGTLDPGAGAGSAIGGAGALTVASGGRLLVRATSFAGNFAVTGSKTLSTGSIVDYAATGDQSVTNALTYSTLRISGSGIKTLSGNLPALVSSLATAGNIDVSAGTFDLATFTASRGTSIAGGSITVAAGAFLKIGGTGTMPANYATRSFNSVSTVEYYGTNQTVSAESYGNLILSSSGAAVKIMPATAMTLAGDFFTRTNASGASVIFTNAAALTVNGHITLGAGTTFNGGAFSHSIGGNWTNNGTFAGNASTITMNGVNTILTGVGSNTFFNLVIARSGITADTNTSLTVAGDFSTSGAGTFTHTAGGTGAVTMSGASKTITGTGIVFNKLNITGTNSTSAAFVVADDLTVSGSFTGSGGTVTLSGAGKKISGAGVISFGGLNVSGTVTTTNNYTVTGNLAVTGSFTAASGMTTFGGATTFSGTASLFNMTLNGTLLRMSSESVLRLAGAPTFTAGNFDVTNQRPNTVVYNATGNQSVYPTTYDNLQIATGGTKSVAGNLTVRGSFTIDAGAVFDGGSGSYTNSIRKDWLNYGTFTAGNSTVELAGANDATLVGPTTFSKLRLNKDTSTVSVNLATNQSVATLDMTSGTMNTGSNTVTITTTRTNNGIILGRITRTHAFVAGTAYAFESPYNTINFVSLGTVSSVTVSVASGPVTSFPFGASVNRLYNVSLTSTGVYVATLWLHYEDSELNGNSESALQLWRNSGSWAASGKTSNNTTDNWVEQSLLSSLAGSWTLAFDNSVVCWNGSADTAWENAANWTAVQGFPSLPPSTNDIVQLGTTNLTFQPTISSAAAVKGVSFGSARAITLTLGAGGSLQTAGNVAGIWTNNVTHAINVGTQTLNVGGDLALSDGTSGHAINLNASSGTVTVGASLTESGGANITFTGAGTLNLGGDFDYLNGAFSAGGSTVNYNGSGAQSVGSVTYNELLFNKPSGTASLAANATVSGNLTITNGSRLSLNADLSVAGNVTIRTNTTLVLGGRTISVGGDWLCAGTLNISVGGVVLMNGSGAQSVGPTAFQYFDINKPSGTVTLGGNILAASAVDIFNGTLDLANYALSPGNLSAGLSLSAGTKLRTADSFPTNFLTVTLNPTSTVEYYGSSNQLVVPVTYGHLILTNGVVAPKTLGGPIAVTGNLIIHSNATLAGSAYSLTLLGNWTNNGAFTPGTGTVILNGTNKTVAGNTTFNNMTVGGSYSVASNVNINLTGNTAILGTYAAGNGTHTIDGDLFNSGAMSSTGTTTFSGTRVQTIQLLTPIASVSSGIVNFNGTVSPVLNTTTSPQFANVNINNTAGVTASVGWTVFFGFKVGAGATFNGNVFTHTLYGTVTNNGTMTSSGTLNFTPLAPATLVLGNGFSSSGTVAFNGPYPTTLSSGALSLGSVTIANTYSAGITPVSNWTLTGDLTIGNGAVFHAGSGLTHTLAGSLANNGALDGGSGIIVFNGTSEIDGTGSTVFNHVRVSGSLTNYADIAISGNFTNNGAFDASGVDVSFTGSAPSVIAGSTAPTTIDSLVIAKTSATTTLGVNVAGLSALTISSGTLDTSTFGVTENATDFGALTVNAGGTLKLSGNNAFPTFSSGVSLDPASTVEYAGSSAQTITAQNYGNLISSSTGARTLASNGTIGVAGAFSPGTNSYTITGSTIDFNGTGAQSIPSFNYQNLTSSSTGARSLTNNGTIGIAGTFAVSSNSFAVSGSTVNFNGAAQTVPAFTYGHLLVSGSSTKTLGGSISVGGNLALNAGTLAAGSFPIYVAGDWSNNGGATAFTGGSGTVVFNGTNLQSIAGAQFTAFNNVIVSNVAGASVTRSIKVTAGTVSSNALLMGVGPVGGAFTVNGTITPGTNNIGTLTVSNAPTFAGTFLAELNSTNAQTADKLTLTAGTLTYGGALVVTNLGPVITNGTFTLFTATNYAGAFASLTFPAGGSNHWKTNNLIVNGTISFTNINPVARSVATSVSQGGVVTVPFDLGKYKLATDADGDGLAISSAFGAANANVGVAANGLSMSYTNTSGSAGASDSFSYVVSDGMGGFATNAVTVRIEAATGFNMLSANGNTLTYLGVPGANYAIENTAVLSPANWVPVSTNVVGADGRLVFNLQSPSGFYRTRYVSGP